MMNDSTLASRTKWFLLKKDRIQMSDELVHVSLLVIAEFPGIECTESFGKHCDCSLEQVVVAWQLFSEFSLVIVHQGFIADDY